MKRLLLIITCLLSLPAFAQQHQLLQERNYLTIPFGSFITASAPDGSGNILYSGVAATGNTLKLNNKFLLVKPNTDTLWSLKNPLQLDYNDAALQVLAPGRFLAGGNLDSGPTMAMSLQHISANKAFGWSRNYTSVPSTGST